MKEIVIDTCVLFSGLYSRRGASYKLLNLINTGLFEINLSVPLVLEYEDVLKRKDSKISLPGGKIDDVIDYLISVANIHEVFFLWRPILKDPKDDMVLELAVKSNSKRIITFNHSDFKAAKGFGIQVKTPYEYLVEIGGIN